MTVSLCKALCTPGSFFSVSSSLELSSFFLTCVAVQFTSSSENTLKSLRYLSFVYLLLKNLSVHSLPGNPLLRGGEEFVSSFSPVTFSILCCVACDKVISLM